MEFVATARAPKAIGPYSQATVLNGLVFTAGQVALDPETGELSAGGAAEQAAISARC
jgi:2-iminobutanoate/2-iminopropanoate deaminase